MTGKVPACEDGDLLLGAPRSPAPHPADHLRQSGHYRPSRKDRYGSAVRCPPEEPCLLENEVAGPSASRRPVAQPRSNRPTLLRRSACEPWVDRNGSIFPVRFPSATEEVQTLA